MSKLSLRELEIIYKVTWLFNVSQILNSYVTILSSELFAAFNDYSYVFSELHFDLGRQNVH